jgi:hypothetical protein
LDDGLNIALDVAIAYAEVEETEELLRNLILALETKRKSRKIKLKRRANRQKSDDLHASNIWLRFINNVECAVILPRQKGKIFGVSLGYHSLFF